MDDISHYYPHMKFESGILKLWYSGYGTNKKIGYAESDWRRRGSKGWENGLTRN